jgi:subtilisin family serine protease
MSLRRPPAIRFRLANHIIGVPFDPPRWAEEPRLRDKSSFTEGDGVQVAVLDSGISRHPWLAGRYHEPLGLDASDLWDLSADTLPRHIGHGTFVAGVVLQYAPASCLVSRRVVNLDGHANDADLAEVIRSLRDLNPDVVNISLTPETEPGEVDEGTSQTLEAVHGLQDDFGTIIVVAAGNSPDRFPLEHLAPQDELTVVVGALDLSGQPAWFSNKQFVNIWAPGVDVISSFVHWSGLLAPNQPDDHDDDHAAEGSTDTSAAAMTRPSGHGDHGHGHDHGHDHDRPHPAPPAPVEPAPMPIRSVAPFAGWARWNGTSFAAPAVSGAIAAEISKLSSITDPVQRRRAALERVLDSARDIEVDGVKSKALTAAPIALEGPPRG